MAFSVKVEIAFATQPYDPSPTWTDVTAKVAWDQAPISINRGRSDEFSTITPSQLTMTLDNSDGRFTSGYAAGINFPNVKLGKRIRVSVNPGAGLIEIFDGFVDSWPTQWQPGAFIAYANITASDRLKKLGRQLSADNLISTYYLASSPADYWMFADDEGTITPLNRSGTTQLGVGFFTYTSGGLDSVIYGNGTGPGYDGLTAVQIRNSTLGASNSQTYTFSETQSVSFSGYFLAANAQPSPACEFCMVSLWNGLSAPSMSGQIFQSGSYIDVTNPSGTNVNVSGTTNYFDGLTHHVAYVWQGLGVGSGGSITTYVDGVVDATTTVSSAFLSGGVSVPIAMLAEDYGAINSATYTCAHYGLFQSALTAQNVADFSNAGLNAFQGESTLARTTRIAGLAAVVPVVTGTPGTTSMSPLIDLGGADYLALLQTVAQTEAGLLFTQRNGTVRLRPRRDMQNQATKWTLAAGQYLTDVAPLLDDFEVANDAIADRPGGNQVHLTDSASVADSGTYSRQITLQTTDDNEVLGWAQWQLATSVATVRLPQITIDLMTHQSLIATWLTVELGDRITLSLPANAPASATDVLLQGYTETLNKDTYTVQMNTSPLPPFIFIFNDATYGTFDGPGVFAY